MSLNAWATPWLLLAVVAGNVGGQEDTVRLRDITVTATRVPVDLRTVTASVTVLTGDELRRRGIMTVGDALRAVPGAMTVQPGSFGGTTSLFLRGGESDYVQVLIDGVPANAPGGSYDFAYLSTANVERIEVLRGPGSVLYGSDGVTGVVNVISRDGSGPARLSGSVRGGSLGSLAFDAELVGRSDAVGYGFAVHRFMSDGAYAFNNDFDNTVVSGRVHLEPDAATALDVSVRYRDSRYAYPTDASGLVVDRNAATLNESTTLGIEASRELAPGLRAHLQLGSNVGAGGTDDAQDDGADTLGFYAFRSLQDLSRQHADARLNYTPIADLIVTVGAQVEEQRERSFNESQSAFGPSNGQTANERSNRAYYAQALVHRGPVSASAGVRLDDNEAFGTFRTYRVGGRYTASTGTSIRASVGRSFKAPTFFENYATGFTVGNPDLRPERARTWEVAAEQRVLDERLTFHATWFDQRFRNLIQYTFAQTPNYENVAEADASGLEVEVRARPIDAVRIYANVTRLWTEVLDAGFDTGDDATFVNGRRLLRRPTVLANVGLDAAASDRVSFGAVVHHVGDRDDLDFSAFPGQRIVLDPVTTVDASAETRVTSARSAADVVLTVRVTNVLNERFETVRGFPGRGRVVMAGVRIER